MWSIFLATVTDELTGKQYVWGIGKRVFVGVYL